MDAAIRRLGSLEPIEPGRQILKETGNDTPSGVNTNANQPARPAIEKPFLSEGPRPQKPTAPQFSDRFPKATAPALEIKPRPRPQRKPYPTANEPSLIEFNEHWEALTLQAKKMKLGNSGITGFIANGPNEGILLDTETFERRCKTAKDTLRQTGAHSPKANKLLDELVEAHAKHQASRELGGMKRD
jgi:hypothetical protein